MSEIDPWSLKPEMAWLGRKMAVVLAIISAGLAYLFAYENYWDHQRLSWLIEDAAPFYQRSDLDLLFESKQVGFLPGGRYDYVLTHPEGKSGLELCGKHGFGSIDEVSFSGLDLDLEAGCGFNRALYGGGRVYLRSSQSRLHIIYVK